MHDPLYFLCTRSIGCSDDNTFADVLETTRQTLHGTLSLVRNRHQLKPLAELLLRVGTVHFEHGEEVVVPLVTTLMDLLAGLPLIGSRQPRGFRGFSWITTRLLLRFVIPPLVPFIRDRVEQITRRSTYLQDTPFTTFMSLDPDDPRALRAVLPYLGTISPAPPSFWETWEAFANPVQGQTTVPSVKSGLVSSLFFARMLVEPEAALEKAESMLRRVSVPWMHCTICNALSYVALSRDGRDEDFVDRTRPFFERAEREASEAYYSCKSFAGLDNYPLDQFTIIEMAMGVTDMDMYDRTWNAAVQAEDWRRLAFVLTNLLPTATRWPREVLHFLSARLLFAHQNVRIHGTNLTIDKPAMTPALQAAPASLSGPSAVLRPLQELFRALHAQHRKKVEAYFIRGDVEPGWRSFLTADEAHERLHTLHGSSSIGRFATTNLHRSEVFRFWANHLLETWFTYGESTDYQPLDGKGLRELLVATLGLCREITGRYAEHSLLPWQTRYRLEE